MSVALVGTRDKLDTTVALNVTVIATAPATVGSVIKTRYQLENIVVPTFDITGDTSSGTPDLTGPAGTFNNVRGGEVVSGTGIPVGAVVTAVAGDGSSVTLDQNATATGAGIVFTFDPGTISMTVLEKDMNCVLQGQTLRLTETIYQFDGSKTKDTDSDGDDEPSVPADASGTQVLPVFTRNLNSFLNNARVPSTNS